MTRLPAGPYRFVDLLDGGQAPWYLIPYDKAGVCQGPATRQALVDDIGRGGYTDVFLFSHGWNNDWKSANQLYNGWLAGYQRLLGEYGAAAARPTKPLFAGVIWPSTALVFPWEGPPKFAGFPVEAGAVSQGLDELNSLAEAVAEKDRPRLYELAQRPKLTRDEGLELARILSPVYAAKSDELGKAKPPSAEELFDVWSKAAPLLPAGPAAPGGGDFGFTTPGPAARAGAGGPAAAAFDPSQLDPRWAYRLATVYQMKDRAGAVGSYGVGPLLDDLMTATPQAGPDKKTRIHLVGHSYGAKVVLSALCYAPKARKVDSVLLLQPAVSYLCFATDVDGKGTRGGFVDAPARVEQQILSTFTSADFPLTKVFHLAVRRASDLGEQKIAAVPPSRYVALGGFGPAAGPGVRAMDLIRDIPRSRYPVAPGEAGVIGVNGSPDADGRGITGHGDISNDYTYWMLSNQLAP